MPEWCSPACPLPGVIERRDHAFPHLRVLSTIPPAPSIRPFSPSGSTRSSSGRRFRRTASHAQGHLSVWWRRAGSQASRPLLLQPVALVVTAVRSPCQSPFTGHLSLPLTLFCEPPESP